MLPYFSWELWSPVSAQTDKAHLLSHAANLRVLQLNCVSKGSTWPPFCLLIPLLLLLTAVFLCLGTDGPLSSSPPCALLLLLAAPRSGWCHIVISSKIPFNSLNSLASADINLSLPESGNILILPELRLVLTLLLTF